MDFVSIVSIISFLLLGLAITGAVIVNYLDKPYLTTRFWFYLYLVVICIMGFLGLEFSTDLPLIIKGWAIFYSYCIYDYFKRNLLEKMINDIR